MAAAARYANGPIRQPNGASRISRRERKISMTYTPHGKHLVAGDWIAGENSFQSEPAHGPAHSFSVGTPALVDKAVKGAEDAFWSYGYSSRAERAAFLNSIADEIEARADAITEIGCQDRRRHRGARAADHRNRQFRDRPAGGAAGGRARPHDRPVAALRRTHPEG
jgi:hypothetical protein